MKSKKYPDRQPVRSYPQLACTHAEQANARKRIAAKRYLYHRIQLFTNYTNALTTDALVRLCQGVRSWDN